MSSSSIAKTPGPELARWIGTITIAVLVWVAAYTHLTEFADLLVGLLGLERGTHTAEAVHFFLFDTPKVLLLLTGIVFVMGVVHTFFTPERTRSLLAGRAAIFNYLLAALLGAVTPFCSCSAVPLFIGFLSAGVPLGITLTFLIAAPVSRKHSRYLCRPASLLIRGRSHAQNNEVVTRRTKAARIKRRTGKQSRYLPL